MWDPTMSAYNVWTISVIGLVLLAAQGSDCVQIQELRVPPVVEHDVNSTAILDCVYDIKERESEILTVKWFFGDETHLVYQWVKGQRPSDSGILKGRLHLDHVASKDPLKIHRALNIINPTIELGGDYICRVSSRENVETVRKNMIVYAPVKTMNFTHDKPTPTSVNATCLIEGAFPKPHIEIFVRKEDSPEKTLLDTLMEVWKTDEGVFDGVGFAHVQDSEIDTPSEFECVVTIPNTQYSLKKVISYISGAKTGASTSGALETIRRWSILLLISCLLLPTLVSR